jgi:hypothetical protein
VIAIPCRALRSRIWACGFVGQIQLSLGRAVVEVPLGYRDWVAKATCGKCKRVTRWHYREAPGGRRVKLDWICSCGATNEFQQLPRWPNLPNPLYIGTDHSRLPRLHPVPPREVDEQWAAPYSVSSFVYHVSTKWGVAIMPVLTGGRSFDEIVYHDTCFEPSSREHDCHILAGWSDGQVTCPLFET